MPENAYLETQVMTAGPHQLHLMVVDGAIRFANAAEEALREKDFETSYFALNKSRACVGELIAGLNAEHAPDLVERLKALFVFVYRKLAEADMQHDPALVAAALRILRAHRDTWVALGEQLARENGTAAARPGERGWSG